MRLSANRLVYLLSSVLLLLIFPIVWEFFRRGQPFPNALGVILMIFGLGLSGPLLLFYSIFVYLFTNLKEKRVLSAIALLVSLSWAAYMAYTLATGAD
jgi:hypothetical protein